MNFDFSLLLVILTVVSGILWAIDHHCFRKARLKEVDGALVDPNEPVWADYARSFFPIFLIVLLLRSFLFEPFKIPSGSMMPTLLIGDFILVNKFEYGLRLPVIHTKIWENKLPDRGDIVVFRYPKDGKTPYIKRVIGLPGDKVVYKNNVLYINDVAASQEMIEQYKPVGTWKKENSNQVNIMSLEKLSGIEHNILDRENYSGLLSGPFEIRVPKGQYFVMGDNRDNSADSRAWGFLPESHLMGEAFMIWMNWDWENDGVIDFSRIGTFID